MKRFKSIMLPMQGHSKGRLHWLYNTASNFEETEKIFSYGDMRFWFGGTSHRSSERLLLYVEIPASLVCDAIPKEVLPVEGYLLGYLSPVINALSEKYANTDKNVREKAQFSAQIVNEHVVKRNGILYDPCTECFIFKINFNVPLVNAISVNAKSAIKAIQDILEHIKDAINVLDKKILKEYCLTYSKQQQIRQHIKENHFCAFVADGSILPRESDTNRPMKKAIPFTSPDDLRITIPLADGTSILGMGIKKGVTAITGGGYSGKSTLLNAIEMGIYNHVPGDGREFVITDDTALKIYAEDGRPVHNLDMSPFFKYLPNDIEIERFSTLHASGSVSQAANIIEAVCGKSKLLLIDEDRSATNFMIRDASIRKVVKHDPIIPFTDRIRELYLEKGVSTILVIGGSSEYWSYSDTIILMDDYVAENITDRVKGFDLAACTTEEKVAKWMQERYLIPKQTTQPFIYFQYVSNENAKKIIIDSYSADITLLTALTSDNQLNTMAYMMERLLSDKKSNRADLMEIIQKVAATMYTAEIGNVPLSANFKIESWFEAVRPIDLFCCANRMRGLNFTNKGCDLK